MCRAAFVLCVLLLVCTCSMQRHFMGNFGWARACCVGADPGVPRCAAAVCRADEKKTEYKPLRTRRELATTPAWAL